MKSASISIGILSPSAETREMLNLLVSATGLASVEVEVDQYCSGYGDGPARRFIETRPSIIIVDMLDPRAAIQTINVLHTSLGDAWLIASSRGNDPELIIETVNAGAREFLPAPITPASLSKALSRYIAEKQKQQRNVGRIYCVTSAKGGVGATSLSINMATSLASVAGAQVALIDLNYPMGDVAPQLNLRSKFTVNDALLAASRLDSVLLENYMVHAHGVAVLPGPSEFKPSQIPGADSLARMLEVIAQTYTCAIVDLASSLDKEHLQVVTQMATSVIVVAVPELPALWRTERMLRYLGACGVGDKLRLVINRSRKKNDIPDDQIERVLKHPLYWKLPNNYAGVIAAINSGHPVVTSNHSDLARSYRELAHLLTEIPLPEKPRGLLKLFSS